MPDPADILRETHEQAVAELCDWLSIPGISTKPAHAADVRLGADWARDWLDRAGLDATVVETGGHPAVIARTTPDPDKPTVLIYGHHDVQPEGDLRTWTDPPFQPTVRDGNVYARGSADNKGQVFLQMRAVAAHLAATGSCPCNVICVIEGEEEVGSPNLAPLLESHRDTLGCDVVMISDTPLYRPGQPAISHGVRGNIGLEVTLTGPNRDLHSGIYGGSVPNPVHALARVIAALHDGQGRVAVPGFYDDVEEQPAWERDAWARLAFDDAGYAAEVGCPLTGEVGQTTLQRRWARPTLECNGITGGYQGPGSNTIVPTRASVKITGRMVPGQSARALQTALAAHIRSVAGPDVTVEIRERERPADAYRVDPSHPAIPAARTALRETYGVEPVDIREGLSLPILNDFRRILGAETVLMGFCDPDCNAHSFDEFMSIDDLLRGSIAGARFLAEFARARS